MELGGGGAKLYDGEKAWLYVNHSKTVHAFNVCIIYLNHMRVQCGHKPVYVQYNTYCN
jgi:hypothetical protein